MNDKLIRLMNQLFYLIAGIVLAIVFWVTLVLPIINTIIKYMNWNS